MFLFITIINVTQNILCSLGGNIELCGNGDFPSCRYNFSVLVALVVGFIFLVAVASIVVLLVLKIRRSKAGKFLDFKFVTEKIVCEIYYLSCD